MSYSSVFIHAITPGPQRSDVRWHYNNHTYVNNERANRKIMTKSQNKTTFFRLILFVASVSGAYVVNKSTRKTHFTNNDHRRHVFAMSSETQRKRKTDWEYPFCNWNGGTNWHQQAAASTGSSIISLHAHRIVSYVQHTKKRFTQTPNWCVCVVVCSIFSGRRLRFNTVYYTDQTARDTESEIHVHRKKC